MYMSHLVSCKQILKSICIFIDFSVQTGEMGTIIGMSNQAFFMAKTMSDTKQCYSFQSSVISCTDMPWGIL